MKRCKEAGYYLLDGLWIGTDRVTYILKIIGTAGSCFLYNSIVCGNNSDGFISVSYHKYMNFYDFYNLDKFYKKKEKIIKDKFIELLSSIRNSTKSINNLSEFNKMLNDETV